ncbi:MAG: hypothetical protein H7836_02730 [Magnetococcus sp. YQC-3]
MKHHNNEILRKLYKKNDGFGYQGADPATAPFIFIGEDANFSEDIEQTNIWNELKIYLTDARQFWETANKQTSSVQVPVHHPFVLGKYSGAGKSYHENFRKIGLLPNQFPLCSFVELYYHPTIGKNTLRGKDFKDTSRPDHQERINHLRRINDLINTDDEKERTFLVSSGVIDIMWTTRNIFDWIQQYQTREKYKSNCSCRDGKIHIIYEYQKTKIYIYYHLSRQNDGKRGTQLKQIHDLIQAYRHE